MLSIYQPNLNFLWWNLATIDQWKYLGFTVGWFLVAMIEFWSSWVSVSSIGGFPFPLTFNPPICLCYPYYGPCRWCVVAQILGSFWGLCHPVNGEKLTKGLGAVRTSAVKTKIINDQNTQAPAAQKHGLAPSGFAVTNQTKNSTDSVTPNEQLKQRR